MEGTYFFGEYLRWNLGWENPNPAGAFVAMWIPLLWGIGKLGQRDAAKATLWSWFVLGGELGLWFLLCKTYSRGALVALGFSALLYFLWSRWQHGRQGAWVQTGVRAFGVILLLVITGFLNRIEPNYVSSDASAGNRLTLWKGGLEMIAVEPWTGWGRGESGPGYMHWFQPVEEREAYAGMVNSYLHVAVERGLPLLMGVLVAALALVCLAFLGCPRRGKAGGGKNWNHLMGGAGASLLVFLGANFFSTLWIFGNLWWLPLLNALFVIGTAWRLRGRMFFSLLGKIVGASVAAVFFFGVIVYGVSCSIDNELKIEKDKGLFVLEKRENQGEASKRILILPDSSTLGESWGKEVRRLTRDPHFLDSVIVVAREPDSLLEANFDLIVVCGSNHQKMLKIAKANTGARIIFVHPEGKPHNVAGIENKVSLLLPFVDTDGGGRLWRREGRRLGWSLKVNSGVGQDIRLIWPQVIVDVSPE